jgi:hypothetical protein
MNCGTLLRFRPLNKKLLLAGSLRTEISHTNVRGFSVPKAMPYQSSFERMPQKTCESFVLAEPFTAPDLTSLIRSRIALSIPKTKAILYLRSFEQAFSDNEGACCSFMGVACLWFTFQIHPQLDVHGAD